MEQPLTLHWQSSTRDYSAMLMPDLFGDWVLITTSGSRFGGGGRIWRKAVASHEAGMRALNTLRHRHRRLGRDFRGTSYHELTGLDPAAAETRAAMAVSLTRLFELWALDIAEAADLLGIEGRRLERYLDGSPFPYDTNLLARAGHLLAINKALRLRLGGNAEAKRMWLRAPCTRLGGVAPLAAMRKSESGLAALRMHLEHACDEARACTDTGRR